MGPGNAADLLFSARKVGIEEALQMRLVDRAIPAEHLMDEVISYANDIAMNVSPRSVRVMKQQLSTAPFQSLSEAIALANHEMFDSLQSADFKEGVSHFIERRPANFTGR